ncbi:MAG: hypothetical protein M3463_05870 [Verrucomicrobiota bacterium]|nr:hypothetical protein [Verrucomicrobiota bacterium]
MTTRSITILGLLQTTALVFGIFFTAVFRKIGLAPWSGQEPDLPLPSGFIIATQFSRYGILLALFILAWVFWASRVASGASHAQYPAPVLLASGIVLFFAIVAVGVFCSIGATTPIWPL